MKFSRCAVVRCREHAKEARYQIGYYPDENLLIVKCLECPPGTEVMRAKLAKEGN